VRTPLWYPLSRDYPVEIVSGRFQPSPHLLDIQSHRFAGVEAHNLVGRHPAIVAADPSILGCLLAFESPEKVGVVGDHPLRQGAVVCFQVIQPRLRLVAQIRVSHKTQRRLRSTPALYSTDEEVEAFSHLELRLLV
jgi:hypothetical protein